MNTENHYQETDLGNISIHLCGEYDPQRAYEYLDAVEFGGGSYICAIEYGKTITGIAPEPTKNTEYWHINSIPGTLTPEYIAIHDRVVNLSERVEADAEEVRTAEHNVSGMELNVTQMQEQTRQAAEAAEQSKDSAAGYAASADTSRQAAEESEQNINAQITGFDVHVAEKTEEAENDIEAARIAANKAIIAQQEQSVNEVARVGIEAISTAQEAAQTATEKAQAAATSEKNAEASEKTAKLSETNAMKMAEQVAADKEQVANDRTAVEKAKQEMTESVAQIEQNTQGISELKGDIADIQDVINIKYSDNLLDLNGIEKYTYRVDYGTNPTLDTTTQSDEYDAMPIIEVEQYKQYAWYLNNSILKNTSLLFYDVNKVFISNVADVNGVIVAPKNAKYASGNMPHHESYNVESGTAFYIKAFPSKDREYREYGSYTSDVAKKTELAVVETKLDSIYEETKYTDDAVYSKFIKECYIDTDLEDELCLTHVFRNYSANPYWRISISKKSDGTEVCRYLVYASRQPESNTREVIKIDERNNSGVTAYMVVDWSTLVDGRAYADNVVIKYDSYDLSKNKLIKEVYPYLKNGFNRNKYLDTLSKTKPMFTWVDDDTASQEGIKSVKSICDNLGIKCTFACVTNQILNDVDRRNTLLEWQKEGFHITTHSKTHENFWTNNLNIQNAEKDLIQSIIELKSYGFLECDLLITPGGNTNSNLLKMVRKWCPIALTSQDGANHIYSNRYAIKRLFIQSEKTLDYYKGVIDKAYIQGDWLIFGTHSALPEYDATLVTNVLQYAISKGMECDTLSGAWRTKEALYNQYDLYN